MSGAGVAVVAAVDAAAIGIERPAKRHPRHSVQGRLTGRLAVLGACHTHRIEHAFYGVNALCRGIDRLQTLTHPSRVPWAKVAGWHASWRCVSKGMNPRMAQSEPARPDELARPPLLR